MAKNIPKADKPITSNAKPINIATQMAGTIQIRHFQSVFVIKLGVCRINEAKALTSPFSFGYSLPVTKKCCLSWVSVLSSRMASWRLPISCLSVSGLTNQSISVSFPTAVTVRLIDWKIERLPNRSRSRLNEWSAELFSGAPSKALKS